MTHGSSLRRFVGTATLIIVALLACSSCGEVPVDSDTAHAITRGNDTIALPPDTVQFIRDTVIIRRDTIVQTVQLNVLRVDTISVLDTVLLQTRLPKITAMFYGSAAGQSIQCPLTVDPFATVLTVYMTNGVPDTVSLRLCAGFPSQLHQVGSVKFYLTPQWCQLVVNRCGVWGNGAWLQSDPLGTYGYAESGLGLLYRTLPGSTSRWLIPNPYAFPYASWASFKVTKVSKYSRSIDATVKGSFATGEFLYPYPSTIAIDSLQLHMEY